MIFYKSSSSSISVRTGHFGSNNHFTYTDVLIFSVFFFFYSRIVFGCLSNNVGFYNQRVASYFNESLHTLYFICMIFLFVYFFMIGWLCAVCFGLAIGLLNVATSPFGECHVSEQRILLCPFVWLREKSLSHIPILSPTFVYSKRRLPKNTPC